jgi:hypothetical protein
LSLVALWVTKDNGLAVFMLNGAMRPGLFGIVFAVTAILSDRGLDWWGRRMYGARPVPADPDAAL